nr:hypothetical protein CFP56_57450 [Quercus suber]
MGHKQESCTYHVHPLKREVEKEPVATSLVSQTTQQPKPQYGEWMLVTKKRQGVRNGRGHATRLSNPQIEVESNGAKGDLGNPKTFLFKASMSHKAVSCEGSLFYTPKGQMEALGNGACNRSDRSTQLEEPVNKGSSTSYLLHDKKKIGRTPVALPPLGWAIWFKGRVVAIPNKMIAQIRAAPTTSMGIFEEELRVTWKNLFPLNQVSGRNGNLALDHPTLAGAGKEGDRLQGVSLDASGEHSYIEAIPNSQSSQEVRPLDPLQGGDPRNFESHGLMEAELEGVKGFVEESRMEHDSIVNDGN